MKKKNRKSSFNCGDLYFKYFQYKQNLIIKKSKNKKT